MSIYKEIAAERTRQDTKWGGPDHDDDHTTVMWGRILRGKATKAAAAFSAGTAVRRLDSSKLVRSLKTLDGAARKTITGVAADLAEVAS